MMKLKRFLLIITLLLSSVALHGQYRQGMFGQRKPITFQEFTRGVTEGATSDSARIMAIYTWITHHISYDYAAYMSGQPVRYQSPEMVLNRGKTTCTGYANLMVAMLEEVGIPAYQVEGFTHDFSLGLDSTKLVSDHAWVAFSLNGRWHSADPTWDSGQLGIFPVIENEQVTLTFWQRLKKFKFGDLFSSKKREEKKTVTKTRIRYKAGFQSLPTLNYIFTDPDEFLKTHLPNTAHGQMRSSPITVAQFCDSAHALGEKRYIQTGGFNFNGINDAYYNLELPDRLLWISDSSLNYHYLNHGDKAINAHNYLSIFWGDNTATKPVLEKYVSLADTVLIHGKKAIQVNQLESRKKKQDFKQAFQFESKCQQQQQTQMNYIRSHFDRNKEVYRRGQERMSLKELPMLARNESKIVASYGNLIPTTAPAGYDTLEQTKKWIERIHALADSVSHYQRLEESEGKTYLVHLEQYMNAAGVNLMQSANRQEQAVFLNEWQVHQADQAALDTLTLLTRLMRDSINAYTGNRKSYAFLLFMDQEVKNQAPFLMNMAKKDSLFPWKEYLSYGNLRMLELIRKEKEIIQLRLGTAPLLEASIRYDYTSKANDLSALLTDLGKLRLLRQAYLGKLLANRYNRSNSVYSSIMSNARTWKNSYLLKLKDM